MNIQVGLKTRMKKFKVKLYETIEVLINFYRIDPKNRFFMYIFVPFILGGLSFLVDRFFPIVVETTVYDFMNDYINISLTVISLFLTISIGYLSLLVGGNNKGLERIKTTYSEKYKLKGKWILLYEQIFIEVYVLIFSELSMIIYLFIIKFLILVSPISITKFQILFL